MLRLKGIVEQLNRSSSGDSFGLDIRTDDGEYAGLARGLPNTLGLVLGQEITLIIDTGSIDRANAKLQTVADERREQQGKYTGDFALDNVEAGE